MNLFVIVMIAFRVKNTLGMVNIFDIFTEAGADEVILKPAVGSFDFAFGLRREGVDGPDVAVFDDHLPLGVNVVGKLLETVMSLIPASDVTKDRMAVRIVRQGSPVFYDYGLQGVNVAPGILMFDQFGIQHKTAMIIQGGNQGPFNP